jgi:rhodanese-related sulfurtransferase
VAIVEIDTDALAAHLPGATLVDVRQPDEYRAGHVPGAALIPLAELPDRVTEVPKGSTVYLICAVGGRSKRAAEWLAGQDYDVVNVAGGTKAWIDAGRPVVTGDAPS